MEEKKDKQQGLRLSWDGQLIPEGWPMPSRPSVHREETPFDEEVRFSREMDDPFYRRLDNWRRLI